MCRGSDVVVVGGGNSAGQAAVFLASQTRKVYLVIRGDSVYKDMSSYLARRIGNLETLQSCKRERAANFCRREKGRPRCKRAAGPGYACPEERTGSKREDGFAETCAPGRRCIREGHSQEWSRAMGSRKRQAWKGTTLALLAGPPRRVPQTIAGAPFEKGTNELDHSKGSGAAARPALAGAAGRGKTP
jgi:Pyridine nucleotide-disulphide oxidoreductase